MKVIVLVVDSTSLLTITTATSVRTVPSESLWPISRKKPRVLFPNLLIEHILFSTSSVAKAERQSNIFGLDKKISWYLVQTDSVDELVKKANKVQKWFHRYASGNVAWKLQCTPFDKVESLCDVQTVHCLKSHLKKIQGAGIEPARISPDENSQD